MGHHTFDASKADMLEDAGARYRYVSREELLWALDLTGAETVADLGSGTGFFTDDVAPHAGHVYAVDVQAEMHDYYREKGVPEGVEQVTAGVADLPFGADRLDAAYSTMTYHEFVEDAALAELRRTLRSGGRLVVADWSATGSGEMGPSVADRYSLDDATIMLQDAGFSVAFAASRPETFLLVAANE